MSLKKEMFIINKIKFVHYVLLDFYLLEKIQVTEDDRLEIVAELILNENFDAFEELAK